MRLKTYAYLAVGALVFATQAQAAFLLVDIDTQRGSTSPPVPGPTQFGFQSWPIVADADPLSGSYDPNLDWNANGSQALGGLTKTFATTLGNITANISGTSYNGTAINDNRSGRDRGANATPTSNLSRDFVFAQINNQASGASFGRNYVKLVLSGLTPNMNYSFRGWAREPAFTSTDFTSPTAPSVSFQAWSDLPTLGGLDGPAAWQDTNVSPGAAYLPAVGGANDPIPHLGRSQISGPNSLAEPIMGGNYFYFSSVFLTKSDASGKVTVYTWSDPNDPQIAQTQGASILSGFQLEQHDTPEPASIILMGIGLLGLVAVGRKVR
jgi:hypothetical protein